MFLSIKFFFICVRELRSASDVGRAGNLRELGTLYWQARNAEDKAFVCAVMGMEVAVQRWDRRLAEAFLRRARQHAIDEFDTLCYLMVVEDVIERLLTDLTYG